ATPRTESGINIDRTAPVADIKRLTAANAHGWNNTPVQVHISAHDDLSGLIAPLDEVVNVTTEGANQKVDFSVVDKAGNGVARELTGINIDVTKPTITAHRNGTANANGWYKGSVVVSFTC